MNTISFSLFGENPVYHSGSLRNAKDAAWAYPGWKCRFYTTLLPDHITIKSLYKYGAEVINIDASIFCGPHTAKLARLLVINDTDECGKYVIRDCDAEITPREIAAVHAWVYSGRRFHIMRDHPSHERPMLGGTWGGTKGLLKDLMPALDDYVQRRQAEIDGTDQEFLRIHIFPQIQDSLLQHDSCTRDRFPGSVPFPTNICTPRFIGEQIGVSGQPLHEESWKMRYEFVLRAYGLYS